MFNESDKCNSPLHIDIQHGNTFSSSSRLPGCSRHDLCWIWLPHDFPKTLQLEWCGLQLPDCFLRSAVGPSHARLVPLS